MAIWCINLWVCWNRSFISWQQAWPQKLSKPLSFQWFSPHLQNAGIVFASLCFRCKNNSRGSFRRPLSLIFFTNSGVIQWSLLEFSFCKGAYCSSASSAKALIFFIEYRQNFQVSLNAASRLHSRMFNSVIRGTIQFFDTTPSGRILNRFSKDMDESELHWLSRGCLSKSYLETMSSKKKNLFSKSMKLIACRICNFVVVKWTFCLRFYINLFFCWTI